MTKRILSLDTATEAVSVALTTESGVDLIVNEQKNRHTETLIPMVDEILARNGIKITDVDAIAFGAGPGAFTGLRVACATAQGMAWAADKPVVAVGNLQACAKKLQDRGIRGKTLVAHDARMHECYVGVYDIKDDFCEEISAPSLVKPSDIAAMAAEFEVKNVCGSALAAYVDEMNLPEALTLLPEAMADASDIARLGLMLFETGRTTTPQAAAPLYVRNRVALTIDQRKAGEKL